MKLGRISVLLAVFVVALTFASAEPFSIDISGLKAGEYSIGEEVNFNVVLLDNGALLSNDINLKLSDALGKKVIEKTVRSNSPSSFKIENDFSGGIWVIEAKYADATVQRTFVIGENTDVEFVIEGDELVIRNVGNVRYTKTVLLKIGESENSYAQNIGIGDEKRLKLISPAGKYNIEVTDGKRTLKRSDVELYGTGNVVGAINEELVGYSGFAGTGEPKAIEDRLVSLDRLPMSLIFIFAVGILTALVLVERRMVKKKRK